MNKKEEIFAIVVDLYPKIYKQMTGSKNYKFIISEQRKLQIEKFSNHVVENVKGVGEDLIISYLQFAFGKFSGRENPWGRKNAFPITWIISKKLFDSFIASSGGKKWFMKTLLDKETEKENKGSKKVKIETAFSKERRKNELKNMFLELSPFEEIEKEKFLNSKKGRVWCFDFTTLYNKKSENCLNCKFSEECKESLKYNYRKIHDLRNG